MTPLVLQCGLEFRKHPQRKASVGADILVAANRLQLRSLGISLHSSHCSPPQCIPLARPSRERVAEAEPAVTARPSYYPAVLLKIYVYGYLTYTLEEVAPKIVPQT